MNKPSANTTCEVALRWLKRTDAGSLEREGDRYVQLAERLGAADFEIDEAA